jgi:hypothetical protein
MTTQAELAATSAVARERIVASPTSPRTLP